MKVINVGGCLGGEAYLVLFEKEAFVIDSGFAFSADSMVKKIKDHLNGRILKYCLLTHSHYDHVSGSGHIKDAFPEVEIVASEYGTKILKKPSVLEMIQDMNASIAPQYNITEFNDKTEKIIVDRIVKHGDKLPMEDFDLEVMEMPGHTKCCISFYIERFKLLVACETLGVPTEGELVCPCYLVGYQMTLDAIKKAMELDLEYVITSHAGLLCGKDGDDYLKRSYEYCVRLKEMIVASYQAGISIEDITKMYAQSYYTEEVQKMQPRKAFDLNASYMIPMIIRECIPN